MIGVMSMTPPVMSREDVKNEDDKVLEACDSSSLMVSISKDVGS